MTRVARFSVAALLVAGCLIGSRVAHGHSLNTASLSLAEVGDGRFLVHWQSSLVALEEEITTPASFPAPCRFAQPYLECGAHGLVGRIDFPWLAGAETSLLVDIEWRSGTRLLRVIRGDQPSLTVYGIPPSAGLRALAPIVRDYTRLGIEHILTGYDHLLFVVALALLVGKGRRLIAAITAFTVAHSVTLACAVLGVVHVAAPPVEATIAASIVLVCVECLRSEDSLARRAPWVVAFTFGLLHGLGFASALLAVGLPEKHVPTALLFFNVGVEIGQLGVIALVIALRRLLARLRWPAAARPAAIYAMGATAAFWFVDRVVALFAG